MIGGSFTDLESLRLARQIGYSRAALKARKRQSQAVIPGSRRAEVQDTLWVQDLMVAGIEASAREYVPAANESWTQL